MFSPHRHIKHKRPAALRGVVSFYEAEFILFSAGSSFYLCNGLHGQSVNFDEADARFVIEHVCIGVGCKFGIVQ